MGHFQASSLWPPCSFHILGNPGLKMTEQQDERGLGPSPCVPAWTATQRKDIWIDTPILNRKRTNLYRAVPLRLWELSVTTATPAACPSSFTVSFSTFFPTVTNTSLLLPLSKGTHSLFPSYNLSFSYPCLLYLAFSFLFWWLWGL